MRGYLVRKKGLYYYKCNTIECNNNKNAKVLHKAFSGILKEFSFTINPELTTLIKTQMCSAYNQLVEGSKDNKVQTELYEISNKLVRLEERFIEEDLSKELYLKYTEKHKEEKRVIEQALEQCSLQGVSNLEDCLDKAITISSNLALHWATASYTEKHKLQFLVFPEGITYNKENDKCRTNRINSVFASIAYLTQDFRQEKSGIPSLNMDYAALVEGR